MKRDKITIGDNGVTLMGSEVWMTAMEPVEPVRYDCRSGKRGYQGNHQKRYVARL